MADPAAVLRGFAAECGVQQDVWDAALVLDEQWLLQQGSAFDRDTPIPAVGAQPRNFRFHARRWLVKRLTLRGGRFKLPDAVDAAIQQRWPEPDGGEYTGFHPGMGMQP